MNNQSKNNYQGILHCLKLRRDILGYHDDWSWVLQDRVVRCLAPTLFLLEQSGAINLTQPVRQGSEEAYWHNVADWTQSSYHLNPILEIYTKENIDVMPLKGAALVESVYPRIGLRNMGDIDLLVREQTFLRAAEILLDVGMIPKVEDKSKDLFSFTSLPREFWPGELSFYNRNGLHIDLHAHLVSSHWYQDAFPIDIEMVWKRSLKNNTINEFKDVPANKLWSIRLSPYDMLAHLCFHLTMHGLSVMKSFQDIDLFVRTLPSDWDWEVFINIADEWRVNHCSFQIFGFCEHFFKTPIPKKVVNHMKPGYIQCITTRSLISSDSILKDKKTLGMKYPSLLKISLVDSLKLIIKTINNLLIPKPTFFNNAHSSNGIMQHWAHIIRGIFGGD